MVFVLVLGSFPGYGILSLFYQHLARSSDHWKVVRNHFRHIFFSERVTSLSDRGNVVNIMYSDSMKHFMKPHVISSKIGGFVTK